jgi:hypothetical protein
VNLALLVLGVTERQLMFVPDSLRTLICAKLADGRLPHDSLARVCSGVGNDETCVACEQVIPKSNFVMAGIGADQQAIQFHVQCFYVWDSERRLGGR